MRGAKTRRVKGGWMVTCPAHDDSDPSLEIRVGHSQPIVFKCFAGCTQDEVLAADGLTWATVLRRLPGWVPRSSRPRAIFVNCAEHPVCPDSSFSLKVVARHGDLRPRQLGLEIPAGAGKVMRAVADDLAALARERFAGGQFGEIAYGRDQARSRGLAFDRGSIGRALRLLERHGTISCVGELPPAPDGGHLNGAKLYVLNVVGCCPTCGRALPRVQVTSPAVAGDVEAAAGVALPDAEDAAAAGDRHGPAQPCGEQADLTTVPVAEVADVVDPGLAAAVGSAGHRLVGHRVSVRAGSAPATDLAGVLVAEVADPVGSPLAAPERSTGDAVVAHARKAYARFPTV